MNNFFSNFFQHTTKNRHKKVYIDAPVLEGIINKHLPKTSYIDSLQILGISLAFLFAPITVEKFKDYGNYLTGKQIELFFYLGAIGFFIWFIVALFRIYSKKNEIMDDIFSNSFNINKNVVLFFVTAETIIEGTNTKDIKILFKKDEDWDMWILPCHRISDRVLGGEFDQNTLFNLINYEFSTNETPFELLTVEDLSIEEEKISATTDKLTYYTYKTYNIVFKGIVNHLFKEEFVIGERKYKWFSLNALKTHTKTMDQNKNIIQTIDENWTYIITNLPRACKFNLPNIS